MEHTHIIVAVMGEIPFQHVLGNELVRFWENWFGFWLGSMVELGVSVSAI